MEVLILKYHYRINGVKIIIKLLLYYTLRVEKDNPVMTNSIQFNSIYFQIPNACTTKISQFMKYSFVRVQVKVLNYTNLV